MWLQLHQPSLACAWASEVADHPGWARYGLKGMDPFALWAARWYASARLVDAGSNVLIMDADGVLLGDIYALLRAQPIAQFDVVLTDVGHGNAIRGVNCGFVYFNARPLTGAASTKASLGCRATSAARRAQRRARGVRHRRRPDNAVRASAGAL